MDGFDRHHVNQHYYINLKLLFPILLSHLAYQYTTLSKEKFIAYNFALYLLDIEIRSSFLFIATLK